MTLETIAGSIRTGDHDQARQALDSIGETQENRCELMFLRGYLHEMSFEREEALAIYHDVVDEFPDHKEAAFRAGLLCDRGGDDEAAIELYQRCVEQGSAPINALVNLAVLYEDRGEYEKAEQCLKGVVAEHPNHHRARHFLASVESSFTAVFDEQFQRDREQRNAMLDVPISDFELSVRARNCLRQMNIRTLGDLLKISESELLSYKNFGETSLNEIKAMLTQKSLRLGQGLQPAEQPPAPTTFHVPDDASAMLNKPVSELELSVRSRKALQRLGLTTVAELSERTESELVTIKNFGQTSLTEIKRQLAIHGLSLRESG